MSLSIAYLLMTMPAPSEVFLSVEVNALRRAGADVEAFCLRGKHPKHEQLIIDQELSDFKIHHYPYFAALSLWQSILYWLMRKPLILPYIVWKITATCWSRPKLWAQSLLILPKSFQIAREIQHKNIQIVHAAWGHYPAITAYLVKRLVPNVSFTLALGAYDRITRHPMTAFVAEHADYVFTQSHESADLIRTDWPKTSTPVIVIMRGINIEATRALRDAPKKHGLILSSGRLLEAKGHQHLIRAFAQVHKQVPHAKLVILWEGEYRPALESLVEELHLSGAVEMPGHLSQTEVFQQISQASAFVLASESKTENLPNSVKEAMSIGIPVITTPTTAIDELVRDGETGYIIPMSSPAAIAEKLLNILQNPELASALTQNAITHIEAEFDLQHTTRYRLEIYSGLTPP